jgi:hypothetical protein
MIVPESTVASFLPGTGAALLVLSFAGTSLAHEPDLNELRLDRML